MRSRLGGPVLRSIWGADLKRCIDAAESRTALSSHSLDMIHLWLQRIKTLPRRRKFLRVRVRHGHPRRKPCRGYGFLAPIYEDLEPTPAHDLARNGITQVDRPRSSPSSVRWISRRCSPRIVVHVTFCSGISIDLVWVGVRKVSTPYRSHHPLSFTGAERTSMDAASSTRWVTRPLPVFSWTVCMPVDSCAKENREWCVTKSDNGEHARAAAKNARSALWCWVIRIALRLELSFQGSGSSLLIVGVMEKVDSAACSCVMLLRTLKSAGMPIMGDCGVCCMGARTA